MNARDVFELIKQRYWKDKGWLTIPEVDLPTEDGEKGRRADAMTMGFYSSNEKTVHAFEIKVTRADFLSEIEDATKAEPALRASTHFWLVTTPGVVDNMFEVPSEWGWLLTNKNGKGLRTQRQAKRRKKSVDRDWLIWRMMMRFAMDKDGEWKRKVEDARSDAYERAKKQFESREARDLLTDEQEELIDLGKRARTLEDKIGVELWELNHRDVLAWKWLHQLRDNPRWNRLSVAACLERAAGDLIRTVRSVKEIGRALKAAEKEVPRAKSD